MKHVGGGLEEGWVDSESDAQRDGEKQQEVGGLSTRYSGLVDVSFH